MEYGAPTKKAKDYLFIPAQSAGFFVMGMRVESAGQMSPYWHTNSVVVTGSPFKRQLYRGVGVSVEADPAKVNSVGVGETNHDRMNGNGVIVRRRVVDVPYPVLVAKAKAEQLAPNFPPNGHSHVVADSTWEVIGAEGCVISLNKPGGNRKKEEEILRTLNDLRGHLISSDTGVAVLSNDLSAVDLYHLTLMLGTVNPDMDMGMAEQLIASSPQVSGGFSVLDALRAGIILPDPAIHFRVRKINRSGAPFEKGSIMKYDTALHELASDSGNDGWIQRLAIGVIPRK